MLHAKGNADDGNAKDDPEDKMRYCNPDTAKYDPENIHSGVQATRSLSFNHRRPAKRPQGKGG